MDKILCGRCRAPLFQRGTFLVCPKCGWSASIGEQFAAPGVGLILVETYSTGKVSDGTRDGLLVSRAFIHESDYFAIKKSLRQPEQVTKLQRMFTTVLAAAAGR